ncbi:NADPH oxidase 1 isoform X2 [Melopsittacus undulatus]|uniref:NADPH oxidase 1 isoform X2 n=1 Tax=Melopsittacus undulatus TaxID=13146 RepID=UPI00146E1E67|nr:NADPH oxidase 1 isoform X2 [Melopsittacus undulatus]
MPDHPLGTKLPFPGSASPFFPVPTPASLHLPFPISALLNPILPKPHAEQHSCRQTYPTCGMEQQCSSLLLLLSSVRLGMGSSISQVPQLQQHADPAARVPQPPLLPPWDLLVLPADTTEAAGPQPHLPQAGGVHPGPAHRYCPTRAGAQWGPGGDHGLTACPLPAVHTIAHLFNLERYNSSQQATDGSLHAVLSKMHLQGSNKWLNPIHSNQTTVEYVAFTTIPGLTGVIITLALILMVTSSTEFIRRNYFEVFWYTHHLFIIYFAGLVIHGIAGLVRGQTEESIKEVHPHHCAEYLTHKDENCNHACCKNPEFGSIPAESWKWVLGPVILYIFERMLRVWRARQKVVVTKVVMHPSRVLELQMQKKGFRMEVGQYIFVNCPSISLLEWHPFTLTSAPEQDFFSIHVREAGDWTERLIDTFQQQKLEMPRIKVDGPFGTASEDVFQYEVAMLVGAGIGVTPFASILTSIWYKLQQGDQTLKTKKIYFYWLCRDRRAFAWFNDLLASLEQKMAESGKADFLTYRLFLTGWDTSIANNVALRFDTAVDTVTGLRHKTSFGRPMWNSEFTAVAAAHPRSVVGVFLCGPGALAKSLQKSCHQHSSLDPRKVKFYFNKENF